MSKENLAAARVADDESDLVETIALAIWALVLQATEYEAVPVVEWNRPRYRFLKERVVAVARAALAAIPDTVWGAREIGREINRTEMQVYHLLSTGALDGACRKLAHKTICGSRRALRNLPFTHRQNREIDDLKRAWGRSGNG
jgi:hypothetical protein